MKPKQTELTGGRRQTKRRSLLLCLLPLFTVMAWVGCRQEAKVASETNLVGTYALVSVDGNKVPCTVRHEGHTMTIKSGRFIINADGTCGSQMSLEGRDAAIEVKATYTREGQKLTMKWQGAGMTLGTVEGDTFTMNNEGMVFAYRK
jgi:hypothetical protein